MTSSRLSFRDCAALDRLTTVKIVTAKLISVISLSLSLSQQSCTILSILFVVLLLLLRAYTKSIYQYPKSACYSMLAGGVTNTV